MTRTLPATDLRVIALDVDGTVLTDDHIVTEATKHAVTMATAAGVRVILASARHPEGLRKVQRQLGIENEVFIACQGAIVARRLGGGGFDVISETSIDVYQALGLEDRAVEMGLSIGRFIGNRWLVRTIDEPIEEEWAITGVAPELISGDLLHPQMAPHKMVVACPRAADPTVLNEYRSEVPSSLSAAFSHPWMLEITAGRVDKLSGLKSALAYLGVELSATAGVGDGHNDIPMLRAVGYSFAMGNASREVHEAAMWVTWRNGDDGVAWAIEQLLPQSGSY